MSILMLFLIFICLIKSAEGCMRMVPPDDVYIPTTMSPEEMSTTMAMESTTVKVEYVERNGCTVPRCPNMLLPSVFFVNSKSEIPIIDPLKPSFTIRVLPPLTYAELEASSFTEYYGLSCEGSAWTISNYPHGTTTPTNGVAAGRDGSFDGKKSPIDFIGCSNQTPEKVLEEWPL